MTNRNDVHSPLNLVTEDYEFIAAFDNNEPMLGKPDTYIAWRAGLVGKVIDTNRDRADHQCHHCGAHIRYFAILLHKPTGQHIAVGEQCMDNRFSLATAEFHKLRKAAEIDRAAQRIRKMVAEFVDANPDLAFMADKHHTHTNHFVGDVARKLNTYGSLSERQAEAVRKSIVKDAEYAAKKAAEATEVLAPVIEGKITITGEVLSTKWVDSDYGGSLKMLVKDDRNFKVWGSVPSSITVTKGDRVTFNATVTKSDNDESFGFFKRPTKAVVNLG